MGSVLCSFSDPCGFAAGLRDSGKNSTPKGKLFRNILTVVEHPGGFQVALGFRRLALEDWSLCGV